MTSNILTDFDSVSFGRVTDGPKNAILFCRSCRVAPVTHYTRFVDCHLTHELLKEKTPSDAICCDKTNDHAMKRGPNIFDFFVDSVRLDVRLCNFDEQFVGATGKSYEKCENNSTCEDFTQDVTSLINWSTKN